jgi:ABC-type glutathione transport system ATPase component
VAEANDFAVRASAVTKVFGRGPSAVHALRGIELQVPWGEMVMLVGPSGCGKTPLISIQQLAVPTRAGPECRSAGCHCRPRPSPSAVRGRHDLPEGAATGSRGESQAD